MPDEEKLESLMDLPLEDPEQPALFSLPTPHEVDGRISREGHYTAERLFSQRRDAYLMIVHLLKQGQGIRAIKDACRVHHRTIAAVAIREGIAIDTGKEAVLADLRLAQRLLAESLVDAIVDGKLKPEAMPLALGIITDKVELLSGGVTSRIETTSAPADAPRTWDEWIARLKQADVHEIGSATGKDEQRARVHRLPGGGEAAGAGTDEQSDDPPETVADATGDDTGATDPAAPGLAGGGGGGSPTGDPPDGPIHRSP